MWPFNNVDPHDRVIALLERELEATRHVNESLLQVINELMRERRDTPEIVRGGSLKGEAPKRVVPQKIQGIRLRQQLERESSDKFFKQELDKAEHASDQASRPE